MIDANMKYDAKKVQNMKLGTFLALMLKNLW